jgi:SAM-dependent methyltransferase
VLLLQGDACALPADLPAFDAVLAANLLCRLPDPSKFLSRVPSIVKRGGVLVLVSPYSWLEAWTLQQHWLGGFYGKVGGWLRGRAAGWG